MRFFLSSTTMKSKLCLHCGKELFGRSDKLFCDTYCKSAYQYKQRKQNEQLYFEIDRQLKINRKVLKKYNRQGKTVIRKTTLIQEGFNPKYFTHYWKNRQNKVYLFCYEYGFLSIYEKEIEKYLLIQWQDFMRKT